MSAQPDVRHDMRAVVPQSVVDELKQKQAGTAPDPVSQGADEAAVPSPQGTPGAGDGGGGAPPAPPAPVAAPTPATDPVLALLEPFRKAPLQDKAAHAAKIVEAMAGSPAGAYGEKDQKTIDWAIELYSQGQGWSTDPADADRAAAGAEEAGVGDVVEGTLEATQEVAGIAAGVKDLAGGDDDLTGAWSGAIKKQAKGQGSGLGSQQTDNHDMVEGVMGTVLSGAALVKDREEGQGKADYAASKVEAMANLTGNTAKYQGAAYGLKSDSLKKAGKETASKGFAEAKELTGKIADGALGTGASIGALRSVAKIKDDATADETDNVDKALAVSSDLAEATKSGASAAVGFIKAGGGSARAVADATGVGQIAGLVHGTLEMAQGGYEMFKASERRHHLKAAREQLTAALRRLDEFQAPDSGKSDTEKQQAKALSKRIEASHQIVTKLWTLTLEQTEGGLKKAASGALAVTGAALTLSGAGIPIVIGFAVAGVLLKGGFTAAQMRRNAKANKYIELAKFLNDDGSYRGAANKDQNDPGITKMRERFLNAYNKDPFDKTPTKHKPETWSLSLGNNWYDLDLAIRQFGRQEKLKEIGPPVKEDVAERKAKWYERGKTVAGKQRNVAEKTSVTDPKARRRWWLKDGGKVEKHTGQNFYGDFFKWDVMKSAKASAANKADVVQAADHIAWQTFDKESQSFDYSKNVVRVAPPGQGEVDQEDLKAGIDAAKATDHSILKAIGLADKAPKYGKELDKVDKAERKKVEDGKDPDALDQQQARLTAMRAEMKKYVEKFVTK